MLKAITFDLGDTLINYGPMNYWSMMRYGARCAYEYLGSLDGVTMPPYRSLSLELCRAVRGVWFRSKLLLEDRNVERPMVRAVERLGIRLDEPGRRELVRQFFMGLSRLTRPMPGVSAVLEALVDRGLKLAVVSNTILPEWFMDESLAEVGLLDRFGVRCYSAALGCKKPDPAIFGHALKALGVEPEAALHVGDRYLPDVWGARRAGMRTCLIKGHRSVPLPPVRPDFKIRRMSELLAAAEELAAE